MIRLITDSGANLSPEFLKKEEIRLLSLPYTVDGVPGGEGEAFDGRTFYDGMRLGTQVRTSMVNRAAFEDCFREILQAGDSPLYHPALVGDQRHGFKRRRDPRRASPGGIPGGRRRGVRFPRRLPRAGTACAGGGKADPGGDRAPRPF